jgi:hypothetical protein
MIENKKIGLAGMIENHSIEALIDTIQQCADDDELVIQIVQLKWRSANLEIGIRARTQSEPPPENWRTAQRWRILCEDVLDFELRERTAQTIVVTEEHVLTWSITDDTMTAFFYGAPSDPLAAVGALYEAHLEAVGIWITFPAFFNPAFTLSKLLSYGDGQLAQGPSRLLEIYKKTLAPFGTTVDLRFPRRPKRWDGSQWLELKPHRVLLIDDSYVIAVGYQAVREK